VADALSSLPTEGLDTSPLDDDIPVLAVETRSSGTLKEASPEAAAMAGMWVDNYHAIMIVIIIAKSSKSC